MYCKAVCPDCMNHIPILLDINSSVEYMNVEDSTETNVICLCAGLLIYCPTCRSVKKLKINHYFRKDIYGSLTCGELLAIVLSKDYMFFNI